MVIVFLQQNPPLRLVAGAVMLLIAFLLVDTVVLKAGQLPESGYFRPWLMAAFLSRLGPVAVTAVVAVLVCLLKFGGLGRPWHSFQNGHLLRSFIVVLVAAMAWSLGTYSFNAYFNQSHLADRLVLLTLVPLIWWRPGFIVPFVFLAPVMLWQFSYPSLGGSIFPHKLQVLHVLNLFAAFLLLRSTCGFVRSIDFLFLTACAVASAYWLPAFGKFQIDWIEHVRLWLIPAAAATHGWLADSNLGSSVVDMLRIANLPLAVTVLAVEAAFLFMLVGRRFALLLLALAVLFHCGVFIAYGFLFWTWILLDIAFLVVIWQLRDEQFALLRAPLPLLLSVILIGFGAYWISPPKLAWHDTRLTYTFEVEAVAQDGRQWRLPGEYFAPYDDNFTMMAFSYLLDSPGSLTGAYGVTKDAGLAEAINTAATPRSIEDLELQHGVLRYHEGRAAQFYEFVRKFITNREQQAARLGWLSQWRPPPQFWGWRSDYIPGSADLVGARIMFRLFYFDDKQHTKLRVRELNYLDLRSIDEQSERQTEHED